MAFTVAFLNPFIGRAEDQAFQSLRDAGRAIGMTLVSVLPSALKETDAYDMVISITPLVRKTTSHPTFLTAHEARLRYVETEELFANTLSYDGFLCISDVLARFFSHIAEAKRSPLIEPGFYYNCPQALSLAADIPAAAARGELALCYFGTNWDTRAERLFRRLADKPYMRIYGPDGAWDSLPPGAYKGSVPFDGMSVQAQYARFGAGLVCLSQEHLLDDIISNRIFEIASVGACAICPDTPWIRTNFGDSVLYYEAFAELDSQIAQIDAAMAQIAADPAAAAAKGAQAKAAFESRFDAATLLGNAKAYLESWTQARSRQAEAFADTVIDIIMRTGGRDLSYLQRAVASVEAQTAGRFRLIVVRYQPIDLQALLDADYSRIVEIVVVDCPGGNRSQTLVAGLDAVRSEYFALLDDDDYLLNTHFLGLLKRMADCPDAHRFAYSDILKLDESSAPEGAFDNRISVLQEGPACGDIHTLLRRFSPHCFLATSATLKQFERGHWRSHTAEDVLLICELLRAGTPLHSPGATCVYAVGRTDSSDYLNDPMRLEDEVSLVASISQSYPAIEDRFARAARSGRALVYPVVRRLMESKRARIQLASQGEAVLGQWSIIGADGSGPDASAILCLSDLVFLSVPLEHDRLSGNGQVLDFKPTDGFANVLPRAPWELSVIVDIGDYSLDGCPLSVVMDLEGGDEAISFGLTDQTGELIRKVALPSGQQKLRVAVTALAGQVVSGVALQAGPTPSSRPLRVESVKVGYRLAELEAQIGAAAGTLSPDEALVRLHELLLRQRVNVPPGGDRQPGFEIDLRTPRCAYRGQVADGRFVDGAARTVRSGLKPWDYFAQVHLPADQLANADWVRIQVSDTHEPFFVVVTDSQFLTTFGQRAYVRAHKSWVEAWVDVREAKADGYLVLQCTDIPRDGAVTIERIETVAPLEA